MRYFTDSLKSIGKILMVMYGTSGALLLILAAVVQRLDWKENMISVGVTAVYVISCFLGGFLAGKIQRSKKYIWGIFMGMMYVLVLLVITLVFKHGFHAAASAFIVNLLLCLGSGMLGGMLA